MTFLDSIHDISTQWTSLLLLIFASLLILISTTTMLLTICVIYKSRRLQSTTNHFIVALAATDVFFSFLYFPLLLPVLLLSPDQLQTIIHAHHTTISSNLTTPVTELSDVCQSFLCSSLYTITLLFFHILFPIVSMATMVAIAFDRFYSIVYPMSFKITLRVTRSILAAIWTISALLSLAIALLLHLITDCNRIEFLPVVPHQLSLHSCTFWYEIVLLSLLFILPYLLPLLTILVMLVRTWTHVWFIDWSHNRITRTQNSVSAAKVLMFRLIACTCSLQSVLWLPYYAGQLSLISTHLPFRIHLSCLLAPLAAPSLKFLLFTVLNANFKHGCREVLGCGSRTERRGHSYIITGRSAGAVDPGVSYSRNQQFATITTSRGGKENNNNRENSPFRFSGALTSMATEFQSLHVNLNYHLTNSSTVLPAVAWLGETTTPTPPTKLSNVEEDLFLTDI